MKSMLIKHIFIKIKANYKRFLSLLSMALLGVGFYSGIQACSPDMLKTLDNFYDNNNVYDIEITSNLGMTEENLKDISKINNVEKAIGIYTKDVYLNTNNEKYVLKLIALNNEINKVYLEEGKLPNNNNEIAVEKSLLNDNNLKINDNINIENKNYKIVGTIISPLYFSTEKSNTTLGSGKIDYYAYLIEDEIKNEVYSNIYINVSNAKKELTNSDKYKSLVKEVTNSIEKIKAEKEKDRYNELYGDIIKNSKKYGISIDQTKFIKPKWYIQNRLNNESYKELINASDNIKKLGNIFPLIFFAISILVSLISMMRMIEEDRTENGTLKSLGYNNFEITLKYIIYSLLATIIGSISGVFIGSYLIPYVIWNIYKKLFFIPKFIYLINSSFNALGLLICTLCICGTAIFVCIHNLKEKPANLMRPKNPKSGKKIFIEKINFIWKKKLDENKKTMSSQLNGVSEALSNLANQITKDEDDIYKAQKEQVKKLLEEKEIELKDITVKQEDSSRYIITLYTGVCDSVDGKECGVKKIARILAKVFNEKMVLQKQKCGLRANDNTCMYTFTSEDEFTMQVGLAKAKKFDSIISGDTTLQTRLEDGKYLLAISDGMGSGPDARKSSKIAIKTLERLLQSGFNNDTALKLVNTTISANTDEDMYATLDVSILDLYKGNMKFIKNGACPTFVKRGGNVETLKSVSLPTGILNNIDLVEYNYDLQDGDIVVMCSDGILESNKEYISKDLWMQEILEEIETDDAQRMADLILKEAIDNDFGKEKDDMTVMVYKIHKKNI